MDAVNLGSVGLIDEALFKLEMEMYMDKFSRHLEDAAKKVLLVEEKKLSDDNVRKVMERIAARYVAFKLFRTEILKNSLKY